jgi:hypothetical protein
MTPPEHQHDSRCLLSLKEVAAELGVTRAAVNFMVRDERLTGVRWGARWYVCTEVLDAFRQDYRPAPSAGRRLGPRAGEPNMVEVVQSLLEDWGEARVDELSEVVKRDPGNVRKYLAILKARGVATKTSSCTWAPTNGGRTASTGLASTSA